MKKTFSINVQIISALMAQLEVYL